MTRDEGQETGRKSVESSRGTTPFLLVSRLSSLVTIVGLSLAACSQRPPAQQHVEFIAMGTTVSIDVVATDAEQANSAIERARSEIQYLGREWYPWENNGELVRLNSAIADGQKADVSPALEKLLLRAQELHRASGGSFDPAVGHLVEMWGFHVGERNPVQPWPDETQLNAWQKNHPTIADIDVVDRVVSSRRSDLLIDLGAIGKGRAVDIGIELLKERGIDNALVNAGGNLRAIGHAAGDPARAWRIAIRSPRESGPLAWLELNADESVSTSGDYERFAMLGEQRFNHILDPRTGRSATHTEAVTVIAQDATLADAASTAIFVAGKADWRQVAHNMGVAQVLRVDASGAIEVSRALAPRLRPPGNEFGPVEWRVVEL